MVFQCDMRPPNHVKRPINPESKRLDNISIIGSVLGFACGSASTGLTARDGPSCLRSEPVCRDSDSLYLAKVVCP